MMSGVEHRVAPFHTALFSGCLNETKLQKELIRLDAEGWRRRRTIHHTKRRWGLFNRETHFLVMERAVA